MQALPAILHCRYSKMGLVKIVYVIIQLSLQTRCWNLPFSNIFMQFVRALDIKYIKNLNASSIPPRISVPFWNVPFTLLGLFYHKHFLKATPFFKKSILGKRLKKYLTICISSW